MAQPKRINVGRAAAWGAFLAPLLMIVVYLVNPGAPETYGGWPRWIVISIAGGAFWFAVAAAIMNWGRTR